MLKVLNCVFADHDWRLVLLAAATCVAATLTSAALAPMALLAGLIVAAAIAAALEVWMRQSALLRRAAIATLAQPWDEPSAAAPERETPEAPSPDAPSAGQILLAEDNDINALLARTLLEAAGYRVTRVVDGAKAVQAVRERTFDLVLMDVQMPALDGLQATRMIRALDGAAAGVPIVALTANAMRTDRDACLAAGMDDFITKPIVAETFLEAVARYIALGGARPDVAAGDEANADQAIIDRGPLERLVRLMEWEEFEAMAREHLEHMDDLLVRMDERASTADLAALRADAHACRGSWAEFGGRQVQDLAKRLERACRDGDRDAAMRLVGEVRRACEAAAVCLAAELAARPGVRRAV